MSTLFIILSVVLIIACVALIAIILEQSRRTSGIGNLTGGGMSGGGQSSYWDKNKKHSKEGKLERYTKILGILFVLLTIVLLSIR